jgi:anti-sigma factor RsiW
MDCKFTEKVSLLIDGELTDDESRQIQSHLSVCSRCQQTQEDFLLLRTEIRDYPRQPDISAQRQAMRNLLSAEPIPFWRRKIALPVPAFALIFLLFVALSVWAAYLRATKSPQATEIILHQSEDKPIKPAVNPFDVSRFDNGGRAMIYTERRTSTNNQPQKEINQ